MKDFFKKAAHVHGIFLVVLGISLALYINSVPYTGFGPYGFMRNNLWAVAGLSQAYLLMSIIGFMRQWGTRQTNTNRWHWFGAMAHMPPLLALVMYYPVLANNGLSSVLVVSIVGHVSWSSIEIVAFLLNR